MLGRGLIPLRCLSVIFSNTKAEVIHGPEIDLCRGITLVCCESVPFDRFPEVLRQALPGSEDITQLQLSSRVAFLSSSSQGI